MVDSKSIYSDSKEKLVAPEVKIMIPVYNLTIYDRFF